MENDLIIVNTKFRHREVHKCTRKESSRRNFDACFGKCKNRRRIEACEGDEEYRSGHCLVEMDLRTEKEEIS